MRVVSEFPPLYPEILKAFPAAASMRPVFAWGDRIYNPHGVELTAELVRHESIHGERQLAGMLPGSAAAEAMIAGWWKRYIADPRFRLIEELLAHAGEYQAYCARRDYDRNRRRLALKGIAQRMASPLYGSLISVADARIAIASPGKPFRTRLEGSEQAA